MQELRLPNVTAKTTDGKIKEITDYLFQTIRQLNLILKEETEKTTSATEKTTDEDFISKFNQYRDYIISSTGLVSRVKNLVLSSIDKDFIDQSVFDAFKLTVEEFEQTTIEALDLITNEQGYVYMLKGDGFYVLCNENGAEIGTYTKSGETEVRTPILSVKDGKVVEIGGCGIARFVTAKGEANGWKWTQYNDGTAEATYSGEIGFTDTPTIDGSAYSWTFPIPLPGGLFTSAPSFCSCNIEKFANASYMSSVSTAAQIQIKVSSTVQYTSTDNCVLQIYIRT